MNIVRVFVVAFLCWVGAALAQPIGTNTYTSGITPPTPISIYPSGADPTGTNDSTGALNAWMDSVRAYVTANAGNPGAGTLGAGVVAKLPYGRYKFSSTLNWTGINIYPTKIPLTIDLQGATLDCRVNGDACVDFLNNSGAHIKDGIISGSCANSPRSTIGFQYGRIIAPPAASTEADSNHLDNVTITGCFTIAGLYAMMEESALADQIRVVNADPTVTSYALILDGINHFGLTSHYQIISLAADTPVPMNNWLCIQCSFSTSQASPNGGKAIFMANQYNPTFISSYALTQNTKTPVDLYTGIGSITGADLDIHMEPGPASIARNFFITGGGQTFTVSSQSWASTNGGQATYLYSGSPANLTIGSSVTITGASPAGYNGKFTASVGTNTTTLVVPMPVNPGASTGNGTITQGNDVVLQDFRWRDTTPFATTSVFNADTNITSVALQGADIKLGQFITRTATLFDTPSLYSVSGNVTLQNILNWNTPASWTGCLYTGKDTNCYANQRQPYIASNWYFPVGVTSPSGVAVNSNGVISCFVGAVQAPATISTLTWNVTTLFAGGNAQAAVYTDVGGRPGALVSSTASVLTTTTGVKTAALGANQKVGPGTANGQNLWWCTNQDNATSIISSMAASNYQTSALVGVSASGSLYGVQGVSCSGAGCTGGSSTFGTWPASLVGSTWSAATANSTSIVGFLVVSSP